MIVQETVRQLHKEFTETTEIPASIGTFLALRPFYIRSPKMQDIEMCVCKTHLHARWAIEVLLKLTREQNIPVNFTNYKSFFQEVYSSQCVMPDGLGEYIRWECTQDKKHLCTHITERFQSLKNDLNRHDQSKYVKMLYFDKIESMSKNGKISKRLKAVSIEVNISFVLDFIEKMLPNIIHHRNLLRNYRTNINTVLTNINNLIQLWIDFSENLTVPVNKEIQSLHWSREQKTIHSGILKFRGEKQYHPYISDDLKHDQVFVANVIENMLNEVEVSSDMALVILSNNCSSQYKSVQHFVDIKI